MGQLSRYATDNNVLMPLEKLEFTSQEKRDTEHVPEVKYEVEVDKLLDGLGPRYADWPGCDPLPVDADMLPGIVPGYQSPFRDFLMGCGLKEGTA